MRSWSKWKIFSLKWKSSQEEGPPLAARNVSGRPDPYASAWSGRGWPLALVWWTSHAAPTPSVRSADDDHRPLLRPPGSGARRRAAERGEDGVPDLLAGFLLASIPQSAGSDAGYLPSGGDNLAGRNSAIAERRRIGAEVRSITPGHERGVTRPSRGKA